MKRLSYNFRWIIQPLLVLAILVVGFFTAMSFSMFKEEPEKKSRAEYIPIVRVFETEISKQNITVNGNGTLEARTRINLVPQVGGRVVYIHPDLRAGGKFKADEVLIEIENIDYKLAVTQSEAEVARAETVLELEKAEADAAREEWLEINPDKPVPTLVGRAPQIKEANSELQSAIASLAQAKLNLQRTQVKMPFAGRVVEAMIDVGEVISANQNVGIVYDSEIYEIPVPLPLDELRWITVKDKNTGQSGSQVTIYVPLGGELIPLKGEVTRVESELQSASRFARVIVTLLSENIPGHLESKVIPGMFMDVSIYSSEAFEVSSLPNKALRRGNTLWMIENENTLKIIDANMLYQFDNEFFVQNIMPGSLIVISDLNVVTENMKVKIINN